MITLYKNCPTIDLHGYDRDYAKICINEFILDNYKQKKENIIIIHGIGSGILRKTTQETLRKNKYVDFYKIDNFNNGITIVKLRKNLDK